MITIRVSVPEDISAQRALWQLAFGDAGAYVDNFYDIYYRPDRFLVLEEDGLVRSMTAWFDTTFVVPGMGAYRAAYLYAVATHPDCRGRGLAGELLAWADGHFRSLGIPAVTTVPAEPSLHSFFARNGFRECFTMEQEELLPGVLPPAGTVWTPVGPAEYGALREALLADVPHIAYPEDALAYQAGCCRVSGGGGLFRVDTPAGPAALCAEMAGDGLCIVKESLGADPAARRLAARDLPRAVPAKCFWVRGPRPPKEEKTSDSGKFAMLKWLDKGVERRWDWASTAYLGLAFD